MLLFFWSPLTVKFRCLGRGFLCAAQISCSHFASLFVVFKEGSSVLHKLAAVTLHHYSSSLKRVPLCRAKLQSICTVEFECAVGFFFFFFSSLPPALPPTTHTHRYQPWLSLSYVGLCRFVLLSFSLLSDWLQWSGSLCFLVYRQGVLVYRQCVFVSVQTRCVSVQTVCLLVYR